MNSTEENTMLNLGLKLGENLKKFRLQRELTQEQLADVLGVSAQAVSRWENGTTYPDITLLRVTLKLLLTSLWEWRIGGARNS